MPSLVHKLGGPVAALGFIIPAVELFYKKLLSDDRISSYFDGVDTDRIKKKQVEFFTYVFGGPAKYTGKDIAEAHKSLIDERGLNEYHFDVVAGHFHDTLVELECESEMVEEADAILHTARPIFESKRSEDDRFGSALAEIEKIRKQQDQDMDEVTHSLERVLKASSEEDMEIIRSGLRMRGSGIVEYLDEFQHQTKSADTSSSP